MNISITYTTLDNQYLEFHFECFDNKMAIKIIRFEIKDDWDHSVYIKENIIVVIPIKYINDISEILLSVAQKEFNVDHKINNYTFKKIILFKKDYEIFKRLFVLLLFK